MELPLHLHRDPRTVTSALQPHVSRIRAINSALVLLNAKRFTVALMALAAAFSIMPRPTYADEDPIVVRYLDPAKVFLFNNDAEVSSTGEIEVATLAYQWPTRHRLIIDFSSVGAISADDRANPALLFIGCIIDIATPCIGRQTNPLATPPGWVNVLSCDLTSCAAWDNSVSHVWFSPTLTAGNHTVHIRANVGDPLIPFMGKGTLFDEARNLVVTLLQ
jgi:hypothetical protein